MGADEPTLQAEEIVSPAPISPPTRRRLYILCGVMLALAALGAFHYGRLWRYERELKALGVAYVEKSNAEDGTPVPEAGPEASVEILATATFDQLFYGKLNGKVTLLIYPREGVTCPIGGVSFVYERDAQGDWLLLESYHEDPSSLPGGGPPKDQ